MGLQPSSRARLENPLLCRNLPIPIIQTALFSTDIRANQEIGGELSTLPVIIQITLKYLKRLSIGPSDQGYTN